MQTQANVTRLLSLFVVLAVIAVGMSLACAADKKEEHVKQVDIKDIPAAARAAIEKEVGDGKITKLLEGSNMEGSKPTYYEARYTVGDKKLKAKVTPEGVLISKGDDNE
jgi:hypothetical protein